MGKPLVSTDCWELLPDELPAAQSARQCTSERIQADELMLAALAQVSNSYWQDGAILLVGSTTMNSTLPRTGAAKRRETAPLRCKDFIDPT